MSHTVEWVNGVGRSEYQPATADGKREWLRETFDMALVPVWAHPRSANELRPRLYRSRLHAACVARCYERSEAASTWREV